MHVFEGLWKVGTCPSLSTPTKEVKDKGLHMSLFPVLHGGIMYKGHLGLV